MHYFNYKNNTLYCENLKVSNLTKRFGTPLYIYSFKTILEHFEKLNKAFSKVNPLICYSVKANSNLSILKILKDKGAGLDIVSGGELYRAKGVGCEGGKIVYASVGKTDSEIGDAINYGILMFNVESVPELVHIQKVAKKINKKAKVALRFNPDVEPGTHHYITTGKKETKFGIDSETIKSIFADKSKYPNLELAGIHMHIGSQITKSQPFVDAIKKAKSLIEYLSSKGAKLEYLNIGGGLGIVYDKEKPQTAQEFAKKVLPLLEKINLKVVLEPGRFIVGNAGVLAAKVLYVKNTPVKNFIIVDAAMNDFMRPSYYSAYHKIMPLTPSKGKVKGAKLADVVGPICESSDFLGKNRNLKAEEGQEIAVFGAGAYGFSMSSNYNSRPQAAEVLVRGNKAYLIRRRQSYQDLVEEEIII